MTDEIHSCSYFCEKPDCIKEQRDKLREMYLELADSHAKSLKHAQNVADANGDMAVLDFKERLADAIEAMPFGDTAASFAVYIRNFK